jgi:hypothetical protein
MEIKEHYFEVRLEYWSISFIEVSFYYKNWFFICRFVILLMDCSCQYLNTWMRTARRNLRQ